MQNDNTPSYRDSLSRYKAEKLKVDHEIDELQRYVQDVKGAGPRHINALRSLLQSQRSLSSSLQGLIESHEQDELHPATPD